MSESGIRDQRSEIRDQGSGIGDQGSGIGEQGKQELDFSQLPRKISLGLKIL